MLFLQMWLEAHFHIPSMCSLHKRSKPVSYKFSPSLSCLVSILHKCSAIATDEEKNINGVFSDGIGVEDFAESPTEEATWKRHAWQTHLSYQIHCHCSWEYKHSHQVFWLREICLGSGQVMGDAWLSKMSLRFYKLGQKWASEKVHHQGRGQTAQLLITASGC